MAKRTEGTGVEIVEIIVDGIKYTQTRPGYYFKKTENGQKRIPKSEWELAFEKYTAEREVEDEWDAAQEIESRKEAEEKKDRETEDNFNGKKEQPKAKKAAKPRKSKDIAFSYCPNGTDVITLTAKQVEFMAEMTKTSFWEHGLESALWCDVLADEIGGQFAGKPMAVGAMISTLREKHLINVGRDTDRKGKPKFMVLTDMGKQVATELGLK